MTRVCPICRSQDARLLFSLPKEEMYLPASILQYVLGQKDFSCDYVSCAKCGFLYVRNPQQSEIAEFESTAKVYIPKQARSNNHIHKLLRRLFCKRDRIHVIEVGAGVGNLGSILQCDQKFSYCGYEPNKVRAELALAKGLKVYSDFFCPENHIGEDIDAVVMDSVLEHAFEPLTLITDCAKVLRTGGVLVVLLPNRYDVRRCIPKWRKRQFWTPLWHVNHFRLSDVKRCFSQNALDCRTFGTEALRFPADWKYLPFNLLALIGCPIVGICAYGVKRRAYSPDG